MVVPYIPCKPDPQAVRKRREKYLDDIAKASELNPKVLEAYVQGAYENMGLFARIGRFIEGDYTDRLGVYEKVLQDRKELSD
jgi:hypothetical protein